MSKLEQIILDTKNENYKVSKPTKESQFCKELEALSKKYGIVIQAIGGVYQNSNGFIRYNDDLDSGDVSLSRKKINNAKRVVLG